MARAIPFRPLRLELPRAMVSFSFDDFPASAGRNGGEILEAAGMRGTFYYSSSLAGSRFDGQDIADFDLARRLRDAGHEIGGHTATHINVQKSAGPLLAREVDANNRCIVESVGAPSPASFAYPYGIVSLRSKAMLMGQYAGLRGIEQGINSGMIDLAHLRAQELYDSSSTAESLAEVLSEAEEKRGWVIFYTHDVDPSPSAIGCSPGYFSEIVALVRQRGIPIDTVAGVLRRIGAVRP